MVTYDKSSCVVMTKRNIVWVIDKRSFDNEKIIDNLEQSIKNKKGFELLKNAEKPKSYSKIELK